MRKFYFAPLAFLALAACASNGTPLPITNNPSPLLDVVNVLDPQGKLKADLTATAANFDGATAIGIIPSGLPAAACQHEINMALGVEAVPNAPPVQSFQPVDAGIVSEGSIALIEALKLMSLANGGVITIPPDCYGVIGYFTVLNIKGALKVGGVLAPPLGVANGALSPLLGVRAPRPAARK